VPEPAVCAKPTLAMASSGNINMSMICFGGLKISNRNLLSVFPLCLFIIQLLKGTPRAISTNHRSSIKYKWRFSNLQIHLPVKGRQYFSLAKRSRARNCGPAVENTKRTINVA
jgi:hypothetical protein